MMQTLAKEESISRLAAGLSSHFETFTRGDSDWKLYRLKNNSPQWMTEAVRYCHGDEMPDDWIYRFTAYAAEALCYQESDGGLFGVAETVLESWVDIYTHDLLRYVASNGRDYRVQERLDEGITDLCRAMMQAQYNEMLEVLYSLVAFLERTLNNG